VIKCLRVHLEQRCLERNYSYDEVRGCVVSEEGDELVVDETHPDYPAHKKPLGLGDMAGIVLSSVGITPERVSKVTGKPCGCNKRKQALNKIGQKVGIGVRKST
jgi:hypothetical protein